MNSPLLRVAGLHPLPLSTHQETVYPLEPPPLRTLALSSAPLNPGRVWVKESLRTFAHSSHPRGARGQPSPANHSHATIQTRELATLRVAVAHVHSSRKWRGRSVNSADSTHLPKVSLTSVGDSEHSALDKSSPSTAHYISSITATSLLSFQARRASAPRCSPTRGPTTCLSAVQSMIV